MVWGWMGGGCNGLTRVADGGAWWCGLLVDVGFGKSIGGPLGLIVMSYSNVCIKRAIVA